VIREGDVERFVARRLRELRERAGYSRYELARRAGVGVAQVTRLESLERSPTVLTLARFCNALGCSLSDFFADGTSPARRSDDGLSDLRQVMSGMSEDKVRRLARGLLDVAQAWAGEEAARTGGPKPRKGSRGSARD
jgi:transcriptional regulator with XRE-family HTH domain